MNLKNVFDDLPQFLLIEGFPYSGINQIVSEHIEYRDCPFYVPEVYNVESVREMVEYMYQLHVPTIFFLKNIEQMTIQAQNALLKALEEPRENVYIIGTTEDSFSLLDTIKSRALRTRMALDKKEQIEKVTKDERILEISLSVYHALLLEEKIDLVDLAEKVVKSLPEINSANVFNILKHIDNEEDYPLFIDLLDHFMYKQTFFQSEFLQYISISDHIIESKRMIENKSISNKREMETLLLKLWHHMNGYEVKT